MAHSEDNDTANGEKSVNSPYRVLVTSGPTRAYIDRIRYIANTSSGALGARIVEALTERDVPVIHIYGLGSEKPRVRNGYLLTSREAVTVDDVIASVKEACTGGGVSAVVHAMAVLDYVPENRRETKKKSGDASWDIRLVRTPKVVSIIRELLPKAYMVGFKLETGAGEEELIRRAGALVHEYGLNLVVANDLDRISGERHEAVLIGPGNELLARCESKEEIAERICGYILEFVRKTDRFDGKDT